MIFKVNYNIAHDIDTGIHFRCGRFSDVEKKNNMLFSIKTLLKLYPSEIIHLSKKAI